MTLNGMVRTDDGWQRRRAIVAGAVAFVILLVLIGLYVVPGPGDKRLTAYFEHTIGVYPGSDLRVLGVRVGSIDSVEPVGRRVKVTMTLDHEVDVPAGADAVIVSPSVVADRYIQLTPAYTGGPKIGDGAVINVEKTAVPVEVDQLYASVTKLANALGPNGVNRNGALSQVLETGAANLNGNGKAIGGMIRRFGAATKTLSNAGDELFGTVRNLRKFTTMLKNNDGQIRKGEQQLKEVTGFLAADRHDLAAALKQLATALRQVKGFIHDNRARLKSNVDKLASITQVLVKERASLGEALDIMPLAADNILNAYDPTHRTLNGRGDLNELSMGATTTSAPATARKVMGRRACTVTGTSSLAAPCRKYNPTVKNLTPVPSSARRALPPLPLPAVGPVYGRKKGGR